MAGTAVVPQGFELDDDAGQPVPDSRLPEVPAMAQADDPLANIPEGGEAAVGTWSDGRPRIRKNLGGGQYIEGTYDDGGNWSAVAEISGAPEGADIDQPMSLEEQEALPSPPEGFFYDEFGGLQPEDSPEDAAPEDEYNLPEIGAGGSAYRGATSSL